MIPLALMLFGQCCRRYYTANVNNTYIYNIFVMIHQYPRVRTLAVLSFEVSQSVILLIRIASNNVFEVVACFSNYQFDTFSPKSLKN